MIEWILGGAAVLAIIALSGSDDKKTSSVATPRGKLPLSGRSTSLCPNVGLPVFEGVGKGELLDIPEQLRAVYEGPLKLDPATFLGDGEMAESIRDMNAETIDNLALQAECAGYLGVAQKLYDHADKIRRPGAAASSTATKPSQAIASDATNADTLERDLAELPPALRDYVKAFVIDADTLPQVFADGAAMLVLGDPENTKRVGVGSPFGFGDEGDGLKEFIEGPAPDGGIPFDPTPGMKPIFSQIDEPEEPPHGFSEFPIVEMAKWYFPKAAARLRRIAIERAEMNNLPSPFPAA